MKSEFRNEITGFFSPVSAVWKVFGNAPLTGHLDSATTQLLEVIRAPRSNTGLALEDQGHPGMLQKCRP